MSMNDIEMESKFQESATKSKTIGNLSNDQRLKMYGLYKQGTEGSIHSKRPGMFDMVGQAKW